VLAQREAETDETTLFDVRPMPKAALAGTANLEDFVRMLRAEQPLQLRRAVEESLTLSETSFFRDMWPFEMLRQTILPELIRVRSGERRLRIWSAACSTGQEVYSVAMTICEHFPELAEWDVKVIGMDSSQRVVEQARLGRYRRAEVNRGLPARLLVKYLVRTENEWEICEQIRGMCDFVQGSLGEAQPELPIFDVVLLRNVLFYFSLQDRAAVFSEVRQQMAADGYLILGNAEQAEDSTRLFELEFAVGGCVYRPATEHPTS
jgi:chemotaxis protein methyltransferase CheR